MVTDFGVALAEESLVAVVVEGEFGTFFGQVFEATELVLLAEFAPLDYAVRAIAREGRHGRDSQYYRCGISRFLKEVPASLPMLIIVHNEPPSFLYIVMLVDAAE